MMASEAYRRIKLILAEMVDAYDHALRSGADQEELFNAAREAITGVGFGPLRAASIVRCLLAVVAKRHGQTLYSRDELAVIAAKADGRTI